MDDRTRIAIRRSITNMLLDGRSDRRINNYLTNRYGYRKVMSSQEFVRAMTEEREIHETE